jgi:hypothetical protein
VYLLTEASRIICYKNNTSPTLDSPFLEHGVVKGRADGIKDLLFHPVTITNV